ncbi:M23 family metallopeptidase [Cyanobium sp. Morenito 9A2]|uniref:M23 family metallopeptidase n=1 Tax=Cyanobium sp. Morenito 9A2 TaxID=2823718 RepID=UPI0020CB7036|nr:M23 family metallopeptidase [Cyanobium sp. Morenito 9A2]MCP9851153.1 peptidoglycan DD-metalloendopeptidase family protein [Cyanobium sp. Morenito 9A2]
MERLTGPGLGRCKAGSGQRRLLALASALVLTAACHGHLNLWVAARAQPALPPAVNEAEPFLVAPARPPRPASTPAEAQVAALGENERLPAPFSPFLRPVPEPLAPDPVLAASAQPRPGQLPTLTYPLERPASETNPFGWRFAESRNAWRLHTGIDLIAAEGTAVRAARPGTVRLVEEIAGYGLTVVIDHGHGWQTLYAHLLDLAVQPQQVVAVAEVIGRVGRSGSASTPHLHFELRRRDGARTVALDPGPLLEDTSQLEARP